MIFQVRYTNSCRLFITARTFSTVTPSKFIQIPVEIYQKELSPNITMITKHSIRRQNTNINDDKVCSYTNSYNEGLTSKLLQERATVQQWHTDQNCYKFVVDRASLVSRQRPRLLTLTCHRIGLSSGSCIWHRTSPGPASLSPHWLMLWRNIITQLQTNT